MVDQRANNIIQMHPTIKKNNFTDSKDKLDRLNRLDRQFHITSVSQSTICKTIFKSIIPLDNNRL